MSPSGAEEALSWQGAEWFRTTHWSVVLLAGQGDAPGSRHALETLCQAYWYPLYAYVRRRGHAPEQAKDLTQEFFARLLERNDVARADPGQGRFRSFLLGAMNHFLAYEWRKAHAAKRGGGQAILSLDDETAQARYAREAASELTPEMLYERRWAWTLFNRALVRLQEEWSAADRAQQFVRLKQFLADEPADGDYAAAAGELGISPGAVTVAVHRLRQRYRELVHDEIAQTVADPADLKEELRHLCTVLNSC
jgi:RNA polymerase sigma factor (sigma-70 family)